MIETRQKELVADLVCTRGLDDIHVVQAFIWRVIPFLGLTLVEGGTTIKVFPSGHPSGPGVTATTILSESSILLHTWPELGILNLNLFSCKEFNEEMAAVILNDFFGVTERLTWLVLERY